MADKVLTVRILTAEGTLYEGASKAVYIPGAAAPFEILPGHAPIISSLEAGQLRVVPVEGDEFFVRISSGALKLSGSEVKICVQL